MRAARCARPHRQVPLRRPGEARRRQARGSATMRHSDNDSDELDSPPPAACGRADLRAQSAQASPGHMGWSEGCTSRQRRDRHGRRGRVQPPSCRRPDAARGQPLLPCAQERARWSLRSALTTSSQSRSGWSDVAAQTARQRRSQLAACIPRSMQPVQQTQLREQKAAHWLCALIRVGERRARPARCAAWRACLGAAWPRRAAARPRGPWGGGWPAGAACAARP
jgi:hypothetical protein